MDEFAESMEDQGYLLKEPVSTDCWGTLYRALYLPHNRMMLLRRFREGTAGDLETWRILQAEIQAWARLDHPSVLQVMDWGTVRANAFYAAEYPGGVLLSDRLAGDGFAGEAEVMMTNLLEAVEAARVWGVLHLGLCPGTLWVDGTSGVQVGEFGFWYAAGESRILGPGDLLFMAPEQLDGGSPGSCADVFSIGMIYVAAKCGVDAARSVREGGGMPEELGDRRKVIARCIAAEPIARIRSAGELASCIGMQKDEWRGDIYRDCRICGLKEEILHGRPRAGGHGTSGTGGGGGRLFWLIMAVLAVAAVALWWFALEW